MKIRRRRRAIKFHFHKTHSWSTMGRADERRGEDETIIEIRARDVIVNIQILPISLGKL